MSERFFLQTEPCDQRAELAGDEARHLSRVLRARVGDVVRVFDGRGCEWPARVAAIGRDTVALDLGPVMPGVARDGPPLTLAVALPKGDRQKWLVEKLTELGVARLVPLIAERGVAEATPAARDRLRRSSIEACKQCGRNVLLDITAPATIAEVADPGAAGVVVVIASPDAARLDADGLRRGSSAIVAIVGPEGGFTDAEVARAVAAGALPVGLGPHVLRVETAAVALAARLL